jgi:hypothetical protein
MDDINSLNAEGKKKLKYAVSNPTTQFQDKEPCAYPRVNVCMTEEMKYDYHQNENNLDLHNFIC